MGSIRNTDRELETLKRIACAKERPLSPEVHRTAPVINRPCGVSKQQSGVMTWREQERHLDRH